MDKFKELGISEMNGFNGGFFLRRPLGSTLLYDTYTACVDFYEGFVEGFNDGKNLNNLEFFKLEEIELREICGGGFFRSLGEGIGYALGAVSSFVYGFYSDGKDSALERCDYK
jgi:hypothetical protein